jgi:hypothetical protein
VCAATDGRQACCGSNRQLETLRCALLRTGRGPHIEYLGLLPFSRSASALQGLVPDDSAASRLKIALDSLVSPCEHRFHWLHAALHVHRGLMFRESHCENKAFAQSRHQVLIPSAVAAWTLCMGRLSRGAVVTGLAHEQASRSSVRMTDSLAKHLLHAYWHTSATASAYT